MFATKQKTEQVLKDLEFTQVGEYEWQAPDQWMERDSGFELIATVYLSNAGYFCVRLSGEGAWGAPIVWDGPKADWDTSNVRDEFVAWLDKYY